MTIDVSTPDGSKFSFPDGTPADVITGAMAKHFGSATPAAAAAAPAPPVDPEQERALTAGNALKGIPIIGAGIEPAEAAIRALVDKGGAGGTFGERYAKEREKSAADYADYEKRHPILAPVAQAGTGVLATLPIAATALGARALGLGAQTLPGQIAAGAASGTAINTADAALRGQDPVQAAEVGGALGAAAPVAGRLISAAAQPVINTVRGIVNPAEEAARRVGGALTRDVQAGGAGLAQPEFAAAQAAGQPVNAMELGGETARALARSAANTSPEARAVLNQAIDDRFESQSTRLTDWLRSTFHYPDAPAQQAALADVARTTNRTAYGAAHQAAEAAHPNGIWSPELERLTSSPDVVDAMKSAAQRGAGRAVAEGYGGFNPGVTFENGLVNFRRGPTGVPTHPDLRFWDYSYRNLRDQADAAFRAGKNSEGDALRTQANQMRTELDRMVPEFGAARAGAARFFGAQDALEAGQNFVTSKLGNREARLALAQMSAPERQLFQDGFVDRFVQQLRETPDRRSVLNTIANSPASVERLHIALGPQRAGQLEAMMRVEHLMDLARPAVQGNSTTARQLTELGLAGGAGTVLGGGNPLDPQSIVNAALIYGAARGRGVINERVAQQVARLLTSQDPARIAQAMRIAGQQRTLEALRQADAALARVGSVQAGGNQQPQITDQSRALH